MTIVLWDWLAHLDFLVGAEFPEADEDALWRCAQAWGDAAAQARSVFAPAGQAGAGVLSALSGDSAASFDQLWAEVAGPNGYLSQLAAACDDLAAACDGVAVEVEYAKLQYIAALVALATTLAIIAATIEFGGVSALGVPMAVAATQLTIRLILVRLLSAVALSVSFTVAMDGWAQLTQILEGHRHDWDVEKSIRAVEDGAIYGVVAGGAYLGLGHVAPGVLRSTAGLAGIATIAGGLGGVVGPLAHGELPTGRDVLMAMTSSLVGAGPDVARPHAPDLTAMPADGALSRLRDLDVGLTQDRLAVDLPRLEGARVDGARLDGARLDGAGGRWDGGDVGRSTPVGSVHIASDVDRRLVGHDGHGPSTALAGVAPAPPHSPGGAPNPAGGAPHPASGIGFEAAGGLHPHLTSGLSADSSAPGSGDWRARGGDRYPSWSENGATLSGRHNRFADALLARAAHAEAELTPQVREIAVAAGGVLRGEDNAIKTASALKEKLAAIFPRSSFSAALLRANDTLRYTIQLPHDSYAAGARAALDGLRERGLRPVKDLRSWGPGRTYLGLNTTWSDPVTGQVFEIQVHTEASYHAKTVSHDLYQQIRTLERLGGDPALIARLRMEHDGYFVDVPIPDGAVGVGLPESAGRYDPRNDLPPDLAPRLPEPDPRVAATDAEAVALVRETATPTDAGLSFYAADDEFRDFAAAVPATDGYLTLDLHGSPDGFQIRDRLLTPGQLVQALRELAADGAVDLSQGIKLISCDTASGGSDSPAAAVARELGVEVLAPDQPVWTAMDGTVLVSSPRLIEGFIVPTLPPDGHWVRFDPTGVARESYRGGTFGLVHEARPDRTGGAQPRAPAVDQ